MAHLLIIGLLIIVVVLMFASLAWRIIDGVFRVLGWLFNVIVRRNNN